MLAAPATVTRATSVMLAEDPLPSVPMVQRIPPFVKAHEPTVDCTETGASEPSGELTRTAPDASFGPRLLMLIVNVTSDPTATLADEPVAPTTMLAEGIGSGVGVS